MSVKFNKNGVVQTSCSSEALIILTNESGNELTDELDNLLAIDGAMDEWGNRHGFVENVNLLSVYESAVVAPEFIEW